MFSCSVLMIPFLDAIKISKNHVNWILGINLCIAVMYPIMYFVSANPGYLGKYLTFHYSNPNIAAMFILHSLLYCVIAAYYFKNWLFRVLIAALALVLIYFIYLTEARSCYIAIAFFVVAVFLKVVLHRDNDVNFSPRFLCFLLLLPLLIAIFYMAVVRSGLLQKMLFFFELHEGKQLESRVSEWTAAFEAIFKQPILGDYYGISDGTGMSQKHNIHLDVLASYGIVPFVLFVTLLHRGVVRVLPKTTTKFSCMALIAFFAIIIQGSFEAALVSGGVGLYILSFGFLFLTKYNGEQDSEKSKSSKAMTKPNDRR